MKVLIVSLSVLLCISAQVTFPEVPGLEAWQAALAAHSVLEGQEVVDNKNSDLPQSLLNIPGLEEWKQHQLDAKRAEALLEQQKELVKASMLLDKMMASLESPRTSEPSSTSNSNLISSREVPKTASIVTNFIEKIKSERQKGKSEELEELSDVLEQEKEDNRTSTNSFKEDDTKNISLREDKSFNLISKLLDNLEANDADKDTVEDDFRASSKKTENDSFSLGKLLENLEATDTKPKNFNIFSDEKEKADSFSISKLLDNLEGTIADEDKKEDNFKIDSKKTEDEDLFSISKLLDNLEGLVTVKEKEPEDYKILSNKREKDRLYSSLRDVLQGSIYQEESRPKPFFRSLDTFNDDIDDALRETKRIDKQLTALLDELDYY